MSGRCIISHHITSYYTTLHRIILHEAPFHHWPNTGPAHVLARALPMSGRYIIPHRITSYYITLHRISLHQPFEFKRGPVVIVQGANFSVGSSPDLARGHPTGHAHVLCPCVLSETPYGPCPCPHTGEYGPWPCVFYGRSGACSGTPYGPCPCHQTEEYGHCPCYGP